MGSGRSQEIIRKPHLKKNGSTKISVLDIRIDSMQHFPHPLLFIFFYFGGRAFADPRRVGGATCI